MTRITATLMLTTLAEKAMEAGWYPSRTGDRVLVLLPSGERVRVVCTQVRVECTRIGGIRISVPLFELRVEDGIQVECLDLVEECNAWGALVDTTMSRPPLEG